MTVTDLTDAAVRRIQHDVEAKLDAVLYAAASDDVRVRRIHA